MIFVDGAPLDSPPSSSKESSTDVLSSLLEHPALISASYSLKAIPERTFSVAEEWGMKRSVTAKLVYLFQREYATVDPACVDFVGTDEATTRVGLAIRDRKNGMVSVAHMDSPNIVDKGLNQMLSTFDNLRLEDDLEVHVIGAFDDSPPQHASVSCTPPSGAPSDGYSRPLCSKIITTLMKRRERFYLQTLCVLAHNTQRVSEEIARPIFSGFAVETSTGLVIPGRFENDARCPDEIVRRIRVTASYEDRRWDGKLLETYDTQTDTFKIAPCRWTEQQVRIARYLKDASDSYILHNCSTSPLAEGPEYVENEKRKWQYLIANPIWKDTFPMEKPRVWQRNEYGSWSRIVPLMLLKNSLIRELACYPIYLQSNQPQRASDNRHVMRTGQKSFIERITSGHEFCKTAPFMEKLDHQPGVNNGREGRSRSIGVERGRLGVGGSH